MTSSSTCRPTALDRRWTQRPAGPELATSHPIEQLLALRVCPDNIWQGVGTVRAYLDDLVKAPLWHFWWD